MLNRAPPTALGRAFAPNLFDLAALALVIGVLVIVTYGAHQANVPLTVLDSTPISHDPRHLPEYALRTTLRMLAAIVASLLFTFVYATIAAKSRRAEMVLIPVLDILQSVPILGFLTFTVVFFMNLFPGRVIGAELASVFAIFTSQAWNMTFSMYQSLRNVPKDLEEATQSFHLSWWRRFWRLDVPFAMPGLVWNTMMSMSGGWFFVVASEAITVGDTTVTLPGVGAYVATAIKEQNLPAVGYAVLAMLVVIIIYDQLLFRPIVAWADKFRFEQTASAEVPTSGLLDIFRQTRFLRTLATELSGAIESTTRIRLPLPDFSRIKFPIIVPSRAIDAVWIAIIFFGATSLGWMVVQFIASSLNWSDVETAVIDGLYTLIRVTILIALASLIWVPIGVWIGLRPSVAEKIQPIAQFMAAFPANILFPAAVFLIVHYGLDANIWLSPLMVLGTQWYILFNVIAGATAFPGDLKEAAKSFHLSGWKWWRYVILPGIFPYYITGAITASGGSWNAAIVAEVASWGDTKLNAVGLGSYIAKATEAGDFQRVILGIAVMSIYVTLFNRLLWRPLYAFAENRLRLG